MQIAVVGVLMCALFRFNLARLWGKTNPFNGQDPNWQHSIFVPLIGIYYLYIHREELLRAAGAPVRRELAIRIIAGLGLLLLGLLGLLLLDAGEFGFPLMLTGVLMVGLAIPAVLPTSTSLGAVLLLEGLIVFAYGIFPGQNDYVKDLGMVITLFGAVTLLAGWPVMRVAWFPIVFLIVALPWPELVYARLAWPLQQLAASVAVGTLRMFGVDAQNFGTRIMMVDMKGNPRMLNVAEACAGLKSVMTFLMVAGTVAFLGSRAFWEKVLISLSAIPIAIFCNVMRVSGQGLLDRYWSHEWSEGFAHQFAGLVMLIPGFFLIMAIGWVLDRLFIEEIDKDKLALSGAANGVARRSKRIIVEVPRKAALASADGDSIAASAPPTMTAPAAPLPAPVKAAPAAVKAPPAAPVTPVAPVVPVAPAARPTTLKPSAPRNPLPSAASAASTLKPSVPRNPLPVANPAASTLKPSSKPLPSRPASSPAPSTLKPSAKPRPAAAPSAPAAGLKPSSRPSSSSSSSPSQAPRGGGQSK